MDLRMQGLPQLGRGARELEKLLALRHLRDVETLLSQPICHRLNIRVRRAEPLSKLLRCQPLVIARRFPPMHFAQEFLERAFSFRGAVQEQQHSLRGKRIGHCASVIARLRQGMHAAVEPYDLGFIDCLGNKRHRRFLRNDRACYHASQEQQKSCSFHRGTL